MLKLKYIFFSGLLWFCFTAKTQLEYGKVYEIDFLESQLEKAKVEKDSATLGKAAFLLSGHLEWHEGRSKRTADLLTLSLECFETVGDSAKYYEIKPNLVEYYIESQLFEEAEQILFEGIDYFHRKQDWLMKMHMLSRLGHLFQIIGDEEKSRKFKDESHELNKIVGDTLVEIIYLIDKTEYFQKQEKYDSALSTARKSFSLSKAIDRSKFAALGLYHLGYLNQYQNQLDSAIYFLKWAIKIDRPIEHSELRLGCYKHLAQCYALKSDFKNAHLFSQKYAALNDTILNKTRLEALDKMNHAYERKEKQAAIDLLEKEKQLSEQRNRQQSHFLYGLSVVILILMLLFWFLLHTYREKIKKDEIIAAQSKALDQQKIKSLEKEMQLTAVKYMLEGQEKERSRIARDLHDSLGGLLSTIKLQIKSEAQQTETKASELLDKAAKEVRLIAQNLQPSAIQQLGFVPAIKDLINIHQSDLPKINFQYYNVPESIESTIALQLYRVVQEALNNALKHANATEILIQINAESNNISVLIEDNGIGFDLNRVSDGIGLQNIRKRAEFLQAELSIDSSKEGTSVFLFCDITKSM